ncbi:MFS multidrug transporter [Ophiocordyceps camponoti-floridani]|uniref:MFS multidrug transporter n=1 Tax=Ophiocordyceps camponoti-floridani TaxID=2030778 RepID=A0A8H4Q7N6_9HYPO|nr:MFS multidrug transporter [Ophiocordyceps camponoti-floridani]
MSGHGAREPQSPGRAVEGPGPSPWSAGELSPCATVRTIVTSGTVAHKASSSTSTYATDLLVSGPPDFEVDLEPGDVENPRSWPLWYRCWCVSIVSLSTWVATLYSTSYNASGPGIAAEFGASKTLVTLGMTTYLLGLAVGSLVVAPMSELYGRRVVYLICLVAWAVFIVPCGLARSLVAIVVVRFFGACFGAVMISNAPATVVDISHPDYLARTMSLFAIAPFNGPATGPIIGGFVYQYLGWRWADWIVLIMGAFCILLMFTVKETYAPTILRRKVARLQAQTGDARWWCRYDQQTTATFDRLRTNLGRPFVLFATEPILWFMNFWLSIVYGILYLCFVAYPVVFSEYRRWDPGVCGLSFTGIAIGILAAIVPEPLFRRVILAQPREPATGRVLPEAQALIMILGAVSTSVGQLGFAWTCLPETIHWAVPIGFGVPFGFGNTLSFIYGSNYLAGTYGIYAASALAGNAVIRSVFGGTLPLAGPSLYGTLTPRWAGTLLGLFQVMSIPIPLVFWRYGARIRAKSRVVRQLIEEEDRLEASKKRHGRHEKGTSSGGSDSTLGPMRDTKSIEARMEMKSGLARFSGEEGPGKGKRGYSVG